MGKTTVPDIQIAIQEIIERNKKKIQEKDKQLEKLDKDIDTLNKEMELLVSKNAKSLKNARDEVSKIKTRLEEFLEQARQSELSTSKHLAEEKRTSELLEEKLESKKKKSEFAKDAICFV